MSWFFWQNHEHVWNKWHLFPPTGACFTLLTIVSPYWHLFTPTDACFPLLALVSRTDTCFPHWHLFPPTGTCLPYWNLFPPTDACLPLLTLVSPCWHLFTPTDACYPLLALFDFPKICSNSNVPISRILPQLECFWILAWIILFKIFEIFQIEKVGAKFSNLKKVGAFELGQDFENRKSWGIGVGATTEKVGASKIKVGKKNTLVQDPQQFGGSCGLQTIPDDSLISSMVKFPLLLPTSWVHKGDVRGRR